MSKHKSCKYNANRNYSSVAYPYCVYMSFISDKIPPHVWWKTEPLTEDMCETCRCYEVVVNEEVQE